MDQSNDDLQNAINGIVAGADGTNDAGAEMPDLGVPPTPPVPTDGAGLDMSLPNVGETPAETPAPETPAEEPGADLMNQAPASIEEQANAESTPEATPESNPETPAPETPEPAPEATDLTAGADLSAGADLTAGATDLSAETPSELSSVKQSMIQDLIPLMDKVTLEADKKFDLYKEVIDNTHDKTMVPAAYEAAKGISDDTQKAEALLYLINESE